MFEKLKSNHHHIFLALSITLIAFIGYNLGQINSLQKVPLKIVESGKLKVPLKFVERASPFGGGESGGLKAEIFSATQSETDSTKQKTKILDTRVVVSKNSDKYHYTWCSGSNRIKRENKIWFESDLKAESSGYILAGNCKK